MENLGRGLIVMRSGGTSAYVGWRLPGTDPDGDGTAANNGSKATPALSADILGDWREEVIWRSADNASLCIYSTTIPAATRLFTLMHDRTYRLAIAWQNVGYNQPPHPGFFLGHGMQPPARPRLEVPRR